MCFFKARDDVPAAADDSGDDAAPPYALIAVGGGGNGDPLAMIRGALQARTLLPRTRSSGGDDGALYWRVLVGEYIVPDAFEALRAEHAHDPRVRIERAVPHVEYLALLRSPRCRLLVCMGGYNTVCELASQRARAAPSVSTVPTVVIPAQRPGDDEQLVRAQRMAARVPGSFTVLPVLPSSPTFSQHLVDAIVAVTAGEVRGGECQGVAAAAAAAVAKGVRLEPSGLGSVDFDGAATSAALIREWGSIVVARRRIAALRGKHGRAEERPLFAVRDALVPAPPAGDSPAGAGAATSGGGRCVRADGANLMNPVSCSCLTFRPLFVSLLFVYYSLQ